jgi:hypothetical protein
VRGVEVSAILSRFIVGAFNSTTGGRNLRPPGSRLDYQGHSRKTSAEAVTFCDHLSNRQLIFCLTPLPVELELTKPKVPLLGLLFIDFFGFLGNGSREREPAW